MANISYPSGCDDIPGNGETHYQACPYSEDDAPDDAECICDVLHDEDEERRLEERQNSQTL